MNRTFKLAVVAGLIATTVGCTRIETGEVGVRVGNQLRSMAELKSVRSLR